MAGRKKSPLWRQAFLRALKRTGNVRASAFEAGVDPGTAYDHRAKDAGFAAKWAGVLKAHAAMVAKGKGAPRPLHHISGGAPLRSGEELVLRRTKHGDQLVRAAAGRWSARIEASFLDALEHSGCVESAAASAGLSANSFYNRRDNYPDFRARWEERLARNRERLPGLLNAAAVRGLSADAPDAADAKRRGRARLPALNTTEAIRVYAINENAKARAGRGPGGAAGGERLRVTEAELDKSIRQKLDLLDRRLRRKRLAQGWTEPAEGIWLPPGWTALPPPGRLSGPQEDSSDPAE